MGTGLSGDIRHPRFGR